MSARKISFSSYKAVRKFSYNQFNRWIAEFYNEAYQNGVDDAVSNGVVHVKEQAKSPVPEDYRAVIGDDDLYSLLLSVRGISPRLAKEIMEKLGEFGIDESLWNEMFEQTSNYGGSDTKSKIEGQ